MYPILLSLRPAPNSCIFQLFSVHHRNHYNCHHHPHHLLLWWLLLLLAVVPLYHLEQVSAPAKLPTATSSSSTTTTTNTNTANNNNNNNKNNNNNHLAFYNSIMGHLRFNLGMAGLGSYYSFPSSSSSASASVSSFQNNFIPKAINASNLNYNHHHYNGGGGGSLFFQKNNPDTLDFHRFLQSSFRLKKSLDKFHDNLAPLLSNDASIDVFRKPLSTVINSSFLEYLINDKNKLSRKLHLLLTVLTQPNANGTLAERHSGQESNELISKNIAKALGKSLKSNNYSAMKRSKKLLTNNGKDGTGALPGGGGGGGGGSLANGISRCFEPYGCFRITEPFRTIYRPINLIPEPPSAIKVAFYLRTRSNPTIPERLVYNENSEYFRSKYFRQDSNLKMIIHGYLESSDEYWINEMSLALLNRDDLNVICVDWMLGASPPYSQAVANTRLVGRIIAHFIQIIQKSHPDHIPNDQIHIIGHSLGAHIAGYTGEIITGLGQITGLDPAEPYFQYTDPMVRLDPGDARFVDVIHSDVASIMSGGFGMSQPCGHVDFYPNGGVDQPGCRQTSIKNVVDYISKEKNIFDGIRRFIGCNHARSFLIYIEAINSECPFMAFPCQTYDEFISGQCTSALIDHSYHQHCFADGHDETETEHSKLNITCPIRLGLDSVHDYRNRQWPSMLMMPKPPLMTSQNITMILADDQTTELPVVGVSKQLHYFLQTNDKHPYCQFHYNVKLLFNFRQKRKMTSAEWPFNGKLQLIVIGSRNRIQTEVVIKQENFKETSTGHKKFDDQHQHSAPMIEYNLLISGGDLGRLLRVELDWRNSNQIQRSLAMMQTKTFRKLLSGTETVTTAPSISTLQNFFNEIQRSLNVNQTSHHHNHPHYPPYPLSAFKYRTGLIMSNSDSLSGGMKNLDPNLNEILSPLSMLKPDLTMAMINVGQPTLRAISVRLLETNERTLFCVNEKEIQEMFFTWKQKQPHPMKSYTVLESSHNLLKSNQSISLNTASIDSIVSSICMHNNYFST